MINIWVAQDAKKIKLTDTDGDTFTGKVVDITDVEEQADGYGCGEDCIAIEIEGKIIEFKASEVEDIEIID